MNDPYQVPKGGLVVALSRRAHRSRNLIDLAMAFRAHREGWGSQSVLVSLGLNDFLEFTSWDFQGAEDNLPIWIDSLEGILDPHILPIRVAQVRELVGLVKHPTRIHLEADPDWNRDPKLQELLVLFANYGIPYNILKQIHS